MYAMIDGIISSTILTLLVLPALYRMVHQGREIDPTAWDRAWQRVGDRLSRLRGGRAG